MIRHMVVADNAPARWTWLKPGDAVRIESAFESETHGPYSAVFVAAVDEPVMYIPDKTVAAHFL